MIKVMTIVGTRPELVKMSRVIHEFDKHTHHVLVHSGQNYDYELNQIFFDVFEQIQVLMLYEYAIDYSIYLL